MKKINNYCSDLLCFTQSNSRQFSGSFFLLLPLVDNKTSNRWEDIFSGDLFRPLSNGQTEVHLQYTADKNVAFRSFLEAAAVIDSHSANSVFTSSHARLFIRIDGEQGNLPFSAGKESVSYLGAKEVAIPSSFTGIYWDKVFLYITGNWVSLSSTEARSALVELSKLCVPPILQSAHSLAEANANIKLLAQQLTA
jgi:hypothetical protein